MDLGGVLALNSRRHPDKEALIYEGNRFSYSQFNAGANRLAHVLMGLGVQKGDKVALMMQNTDRYCFAFFAIMKAGGVAVPMNYRLAPPEARYVLEHSDSKVLIFDPEYLPLVREIRGSLPGISHYIQAWDKVDEANVIEWDRAVEGAPEYDPDLRVEEWDDCEILYTSGTTGRPKGALFDHHRIIPVFLWESILRAAYCTWPHFFIRRSLTCSWWPGHTWGQPMLCKRCFIRSPC